MDSQTRTGRRSFLAAGSAAAAVTAALTAGDAGAAPVDEAHEVGYVIQSVVDGAHSVGDVTSFITSAGYWAFIPDGAAYFFRQDHTLYLADPSNSQFVAATDQPVAGNFALAGSYFRLVGGAPQLQSLGAALFTDSGSGVDVSESSVLETLGSKVRSFPAAPYDGLLAGLNPGHTLDELAEVVDGFADVSGSVQPVINVTQFAAQPGVSGVGSWTSSTTFVANHNPGDPAVFTPAMVGALIAVRGAGPAGDGTPVDHWTSVATVVDDFTITVAAAASNPGSGQVFHASQDARTPLTDALAAARAQRGGIVVLPAGTYCVSEVVTIDDLRNSVITGPGAIVRYHSAAAGVLPEATPAADAARIAQSALRLRGCSDITIRDLRFEGDYAHISNRGNLGAAILTDQVGGRYVQRLTLDTVRSFYGAGLIVEGMNNGAPNDDDNARGTRLRGCYVYGWRGVNVLSTHCVVDGCHFEQPADDTTYDNYQRSSMALYLYAGRQSCVITNNTFRYVRRWALKAAGSLVPIRNVVFANNDVWECGGGVQITGRERQENANAIITGNTFTDCALNQPGWNESVVAELSCVKNGIINDNAFYWTKANTDSSGHFGIRVTAAGENDSPAEGILIENNIMQGLLTGELSPGQIMNGAICIIGVGNYVFTPDEGFASGDPGGTMSGARIAGNSIKSCAGVAVIAEDAAYLTIESNHISNALGIQLDGCAFPVVRNNVYMSGVAGTSYAAIRMLNCSWPIIYDNHGSEPLFRPSPLPSIMYGRGMATDDNGDGRTPVDFPLLGRRGLAVPTDGYSEVVMAYGSPPRVNGDGDIVAGGWRNGDTVAINTAVFTYKHVSPGPGEFNSLALDDVGHVSLLSRINSLSGYEAADYGEPFGVETRHIRIRRTVRNDRGWLVEVRTKLPCAGRLLPTGSGTDFGVTFAQGGRRGETVIWSPLCEAGAVPHLVPVNTEARDLLKDNGWMMTLDTDRDVYGSSVVVDHGQPAEDVPERFRWAIS